MCASVSERVRQQYKDNILWIQQAGKHNMVKLGKICMGTKLQSAVFL